MSFERVRKSVLQKRCSFEEYLIYAARSGIGPAPPRNVNDTYPLDIVEQNIREWMCRYVLERKRAVPDRWRNVAVPCLIDMNTVKNRIWNKNQLTLST